MLNDPVVRSTILTITWLLLSGASALGSVHLILWHITGVQPLKQLSSLDINPAACMAYGIMVGCTTAMFALVYGYPMGVL